MRIVGSLLYIAFNRHITDQLQPISNSFESIREDRRYKLKEVAYQFDLYQGVLSAGAKLGGQVCMATDILDEEMLESYFSNKNRVSELLTASFRIIDKLLQLIIKHKTDSLVPENLTFLPRTEYPHHSIEEFEQHVKMKNKGKRKDSDD